MSGACPAYLTPSGHGQSSDALFIGGRFRDDRRLEWDTLLRKARLTRGHTVAKKGATSLCVGKPFFGMVGIETRYLTFVPSVIAAVEMINRPPFFERFAASIRHEDAAEGSRLTYKLTFTARPRFLRWLLHPIMLVVLRYETRKRLTALEDFLRLEGEVAN